MTNRFSFMPHRLTPSCSMPGLLASVCRFSVGLALIAGASAASAQVDDDPEGPATVSRPVVQSTAPSPSRILNAALARLASDPRNVSALFDAAEAALNLGDSDAALGFLARASEAQPGNARTQVLLGKANLVAENPIDAVRAFDEAERLGGDTFAMAGDRALAYDLVGDNARAQRWYQVASSRGASDELIRHHALSLAISGDRRGAEALIAPLIAKQDRPTWRTRTFVMAVTGGPDEAVAVAYASMPQDLAASIAPYLRYMPRLTQAQQAAAANFGKFPRAADIGRDDPRIAQYAALNPRAPRFAEAGLVPAGAPLGPTADKPSREKRRRPGKEDSRVASAAPKVGRVATTSITQPPVASTPPPSAYSSPVLPPPVQTAAVAPRPKVLSALDVPPGTPRPAIGPIRPATAAPERGAAASTPVLPPQTRIAAAQSVAQPLPRATPPVQAPLVAQPAPTPASPPTNTAPPQVASAETSSPGVSTTAIAPSTASQASAPAITLPATAPANSSAGAFDLATMANSTAAVIPAPSQVAPAQVATPTPTPASSPSQIESAPARSQVASAAASTAVPESTVQPDRPADFVSLFKSFAPPAEERQPDVAAVDISRLPPKPAAKVEKPDPRGERPDGPSDVARISAKETEKPPAKDAKVSSKDAKAVAAAKAAAKTAQDAKDAKAKKAAPSHPSRIWVQVLTGGNKDMMDNEWRRLIKEAPEVLRARKPYLSPWRSNFRLLTGPFESAAAAQDFVGKLRKSGLASYQWTSPAGQAVDTLSLK